MLKSSTAQLIPTNSSRRSTNLVVCLNCNPNITFWVDHRMHPVKGPNTSFWSIQNHKEKIGKVTSAIYSPRLGQNIALAMILAEHANIGSVVNVLTRSGPAHATLVERPFYDPKKRKLLLLERRSKLRDLKNVNPYYRVVLEAP